MKLGSVLAVAMLLLFGLVFGAGHAVAASLPGELLYNLKLAAEQVRMDLTIDPQARAELRLELAEQRLDEITRLVERGLAPGAPVVDRTTKQLDAALEAATQGGMNDEAASQALHQLALALQQRQRTMEEMTGEMPDPVLIPFRVVLRAMERVREEAHAGQGDPDGENVRQRIGSPPDPTEIPDPRRTPMPFITPEANEPAPEPSAPPVDEPGLVPGPSDKPGEPGPEPNPTDQAGPGPGPSPDSPVQLGPQPSDQDSVGGPNPTQTPVGPGRDGQPGNQSPGQEDVGEGGGRP